MLYLNQLVATEYSTPQPELPHCCLPQPVPGNADTSPTLEVADTPVKVIVTVLDAQEFSFHATEGLSHPRG